MQALTDSQSPSTVRNYANDWASFRSWCTTGRRLEFLPAHPQTVAAYLTESAELRDGDGNRAYSVATIARWSTSISYFHRAANMPAPGDSQLVRSTLAGLRRRYASEGQRPVSRRAPLTTTDLSRVISAARWEAHGWAAQVRERRDSAILLLGFSGAFRRGELSALTFADMKMVPAVGIHLRVRRSKTDQTGTGMTKAIVYGQSWQTCPVCAYVRWHTIADAWDREGRPGVIRQVTHSRDFSEHVCRLPFRASANRDLPVFRPIRKNGVLAGHALSGSAIHQLIRRRARSAGFTEDEVDRLGGHSLRAGFVTESKRNGADDLAVMRQTGHKDRSMIEVYTREHTPSVNNAVGMLEL